VLSDSSYLTAMYTYLGAASAVLVYLALILGRNWQWRAGWVALVVLIAAALLLTPAYPDANIKTLAPALVVAVFEGLINGPEAAQHAIRPLAYMLGLALLLSILLRLTIFRRREKKSSPQP
jgi:hypothetical protein